MSYSNIQKLPICEVIRVSHHNSSVDGILLTPIGYLMEPKSKLVVFFKIYMYFNLFFLL